MSDLESYLKSGQRLGLKEKDLLDFVKSEREREDQCEKERMEREERNMAREMKKLEMEHSIEMERARSTSTTGTRERGARAKLPKLPCFNDKYDDMDSYLKRFERFAVKCRLVARALGVEFECASSG